LDNNIVHTRSRTFRA